MTPRRDLAQDFAVRPPPSAGRTFNPARMPEAGASPLEVATAPGRNGLLPPSNGLPSAARAGELIGASATMPDVVARAKMSLGLQTNLGNARMAALMSPPAERATAPGPARIEPTPTVPAGPMPAPVAPATTAAARTAPIAPKTPAVAAPQQPLKTAVTDASPPPRIEPVPAVAAAPTPASPAPAKTAPPTAPIAPIAPIAAAPPPPQPAQSRASPVVAPPLERGPPALPAQAPAATPTELPQPAKAPVAASAEKKTAHAMSAAHGEAAMTEAEPETTAAPGVPVKAAAGRAPAE
jgi:hypothetical protein